jgi:hypothetical protein
MKELSGAASQSFSVAALFERVGVSRAFGKLRRSRREGVSMKNKIKTLFGVLVAASASALFAQPPAPVPIPAATSSVTGSISQFNYGPDGRVQGFVVAPNTLVSLPPDLAMQVEILAKVGDQVRASGFATQAGSGMQLM